MNRPALVGLRLLPVFVCLALYWTGLQTWFVEDDFAWLGLSREVSQGSGLGKALFAPMAQGTIRVWSERAFFLAFHHVFGMDPLPFRVAVFLTQAANLLLLAHISLRLTGSRLASLLSGVFWLANPALAVPLTWTSAYNQVLCSFFLLLEFSLLLNYVETGRSRHYFWLWVVFLLGFGAMEVNALFPALAALYTAFFARHRFRKMLPMFVPSAVFALLHVLYIPRPKTGLYTFHLDASMFPTLLSYWQLALGPEQAGWLPAKGILAPVGTLLLSGAICGYTIWRAHRRDWLPVFLLGWFLITLSPVLPLREHISGYYLTVPAIGLAILGACAVAGGIRTGGVKRATAAALAVLYLGAAVPTTLTGVQFRYRLSQEVRNLVLGVVRARRLHPREMIILENVSPLLFWTAVAPNAFRLYGVEDVYLAPGSDERIGAKPGYENPADWVLPAQPALRAIGQYRAVVYDATGKWLQNVTDSYAILGEVKWKATPSRRVNLGVPQPDGVLGSTWHQPLGGRRWMPQEATVTLDAPSGGAKVLYLKGSVPSALLAPGPLSLNLSVNGTPLGPVEITAGDQDFEVEVKLPENNKMDREVNVLLHVERTQRGQLDGRPVSVSFGVIEVR